MERGTEFGHGAGRERAAALCVHLHRVEGVGVEEIARRLGRRPATVRGYLSDPDGEKARARKERYRGTCEVCGAPTSGGDGPSGPRTRCRRCVTESRRRWGRERVLEAMARWELRHGHPPTSYDWNATFARQRGRSAERRLRDGNWPSASTVSEVFEGWGAARAAYRERVGEGGNSPASGADELASELPT